MLIVFLTKIQPLLFILLPILWKYFNLCKVLDFEIADKNMVDDYNHLMPKGSKYIKCQYYQKQKESRSGIHYKLFPKIVHVLPTQV